ncbi:putative transcription factor C3H family [Helianthus anomalus]
MIAQTLSEHELLDQIESSIARMIDILENRPRFPTSPPPKIPPPPISATEPPACPSSPYVIAAPKPSLLRASLPAPSGPKAAPPSAYATTQAPYSSLNVTISFKDNRAWKISSVLEASKLMYLVVFEEPFNIIEESHEKRVSKSGSHKREWRPPWRSVKASPSVAGRTEWRPPWKFAKHRLDSVLEDKDVFKGAGMIRTSCNYTHCDVVRVCDVCVVELVAVMIGLQIDFEFDFALKDFYEDLFEELNKYGEIESLNVCDNLADHMVGNVYVQFREEEYAAKALKNLSGRFYAGRPIIVDFSPVTDFREATCRQYEENTCNRGGYCNFMHLKKIGRELRRQLFGRYRRRHSRSRSRSRSPYRHRSYEERGHGSRGHSRRYDDRDRDYDRERDYYHESRSRRHRSTSPLHRRERSRSSEGRKHLSPVREGSEERRAKIEQWNRQREQAKVNEVNGNNNDNYVENVDGSYNQPLDQYAH